MFTGLAVSLILAGFVSFYADPNEDGLERVASDHGFAADASESINANIFSADYAITGVADDRMSLAIAGVLGVAVTAIIGFGLFAYLARDKKQTPVA
jgi:hypothetical protein